MTHCTHTETCESCFEANRKLKVEGSLKSGLVSELRELLGVDHLKGQRQLEAAVAEVKRLKEVAQKLEDIRVGMLSPAERDFELNGQDRW